MNTACPVRNQNRLYVGDLLWVVVGGDREWQIELRNMVGDMGKIEEL